MSTQDRRPHHTPPHAPTPALVLAALERAALHRGDPAAGVPVWAILAQLAIPRRAHAARTVESLLDALVSAGAVGRSRRRGARLYTLTPGGARLLRRARRVGAPTLPESPQHRAWRHAHTVAGAEIGRLRGALRASVRDAAALLADTPPPPSQAWFELAERLRRDAWLVGSASHCLYEWREPNDAVADIDSGPPGRRNLALWRLWRD